MPRAAPVRAIRWPTHVAAAAPPGARPAGADGRDGSGGRGAAPPDRPPFGLDAAELCDQAGPEITRALGFRTALAPAAAREDTGADGGWLPLGLLACGGERVRLALSAGLVAPLIGQLFGGSPSGSPLEERPGPRSASWWALRLLLCTSLADAVSRCLGGRQVTPDPRAAPDPAERAAGPAARLVVRLQTAGADGALSLVRLAEPERAPADAGTGPAAGPEGPGPSAAARPAGRTSAAWAERARAQALLVDTEVALEVARIRLPLHRLIALRPGDVIPIEQPRMLRLMCGGRALARLPAADLGPGRSAAGEDTP